MNDLDREMFDEFMEEADEYLLLLDELLSTTDYSQISKSDLEFIMRIMHSLKGSSGFVGLTNMSQLTHQLEDLIVNIRDNKLKFTENILDVIFEGFDLTKNILDRAKENPEDNTLNNEEEEFIEKVKKVNQSSESREEVPDVKQKINFNKKAIYYLGYNDISKNLITIIEIIDTAFFEGGSEKNFIKVKEILIEVRNLSLEIYSDSHEIIERLDAIINEIPILRNEMPDIVSNFSDDLINSINIFISKLSIFTDSIIINNIKKYYEEAKKQGIKPNEFKNFIREFLKKEKAAKKLQKNSKKTGINEKILRVPQEKIDDFMFSVGSLIIKSDSLKFFHQLMLNKKQLETNEIKNYRDTVLELNEMIFSLQKHLMEIRKLPVSSLLNRFFRLVRDTSKKLNKKIEMKLEGEQIRVDSSILNELEPVLTHILRNSCDHGVETPEIRKKNQKSDIGTVWIRSKIDDENFYLVIEDNGAGIDVNKIREIAVKKGFKSQEEVDKAEDKEILNYIFLPGFSCAEKVSEVSGRGVGMDVVFNTLKSLNGKFDIDTVLGKGTTITLTIPQMSTLVTKRALMVESGNINLAFLEDDIESTLEISCKDFIKYKDKKMFNYKNRVIPLHYLNDTLNLKRKIDFENNDTIFKIIIVLTNNGLIAVAVDKLLDYQTIVVKEFKHNLLMGLKGVKSFTITGKGDIVLIISPEQIMNN